jgi:release factor glutamine methyltransferase
MAPTPLPPSIPDEQAAQAGPWTIGRVLAWAGQDLKQRGVTDTPRLEAELLLGHVLGCDRIRLLLDSLRPLSSEELSAFRALLLRRRKAEPVAYLLGQREFYGLPFRVNRDVLIPRPDTETLVRVALERTQDRAQYGRAVDVCTGSGCVAIAIARERPSWRFSASDLSEAAAEVARYNVLRLGVHWNLEVRTGDLLEPFGDERFDLITANPPYIPEDEIARLQPDIVEHEPRLALDGGREGLVVVARLLKAARNRLEPGGLLALEVGAGQAERVQKGFVGYGFSEVEAEVDYGGIERVVSGRWPG